MTDNTLCIFANCKNERLLYSNFCQKHEDSKLKKVKADDNTLDKEIRGAILKASSRFGKDPITKGTIFEAYLIPEGALKEITPALKHLIASQKKQAEVEFIKLLENNKMTTTEGYEVVSIEQIKEILNVRPE